ncbi:hypothetical protein [Magnetovibrio blakemorei]|uniref:Lipoprotein SmpA/OmlA domain-containing protein n=1 Tax=Magnetovibrio blakemorei TaxID=28181 RepID=A0A1E5Q3R7_9PROT|nr:hypothetical protein [Magnetovibrio blakemorei]OEJ64381.1 hypothetical protein BEN30_16340 [Magnetovibrio blakemorei]
MRSLFLIAATAFALSACAQPSERLAPATTPNTVQEQPTKPKITTAQLLGQGGSWVMAQLGEPAFVRTERTANIWQYKNDVCVLNVFLYADDDTQKEVKPRVLHFDARDAQGTNTDRDTCLSALQD